MVKGILLSTLFTFSLSAASEYWGVICPGAENSYKFEVIRNNTWSSAMITNLNKNGQSTNVMEAFFNVDESIQLQIIEANTLREITMDLPSGDLTKPTQVRWEKSNYPFGESFTHTCYDTNGFTSQIIQKIKKSNAFNRFLNEAKMRLDLTTPKEFFYDLVNVSFSEKMTTFFIDVRWSMAQKECTTRFTASSDFTEVSLESSGEDMFVCDWS